MIFAGSSPVKGTIFKENFIKVYGPYTRKDQRKHVIIVYDEGTRRTKSYPRYLLETHLKRELTYEETVDHIDNDKTNDSIENLQILSLSENAKKQQVLNPRKIYEFVCPCCGRKAIKYFNQVS